MYSYNAIAMRELREYYMLLIFLAASFILLVFDHLVSNSMNDGCATLVNTFAVKMQVQMFSYEPLSLPFATSGRTRLQDPLVVIHMMLNRII